MRSGKEESKAGVTQSLSTQIHFDITYTTRKASVVYYRHIFQE